MLEKQPADPFLLYGMGMEYKKGGDLSQAVAYFDRTLAADPGYCYAYYQKGQVQEAMGDPTAAKETYRQGIAAAVRKGDEHAKGEIEGALELIS